MGHQAEARTRKSLGWEGEAWEGEGGPLPHTNPLVGLQTEAPAGMQETVGDALAGVGLVARVVAWLEQEMPEIQILEILGRTPLLRPDKFQVVASGLEPLGLTVIQSSPSGRGSVPLLSTPSSNPRACRRSISSRVSCKAGSPPVNTM
mgnify:CR=1 FL=1